VTRPTRLPVVPLAVATQLVLGLPLGIERPRKRRARKPVSPWLPPRVVERVA